MHSILLVIDQFSDYDDQCLYMCMYSLHIHEPPGWKVLTLIVDSENNRAIQSSYVKLLRVPDPRINRTPYIIKREPGSVIKTCVRTRTRVLQAGKPLTDTPPNKARDSERDRSRV